MASEKVQQLGVVTGRREGNAFYGRVSGVVPKAGTGGYPRLGTQNNFSCGHPWAKCLPAAQSGLAKGTNSKYSALPLTTIKLPQTLPSPFQHKEGLQVKIHELWSKDLHVLWSGVYV